LFKNTNLIEFFKDLIIPPVCSVCGNISPELICLACKSKIEKIDGDVCKYCGRPISDYKKSQTMTGADKSSCNTCSLCRKEKFSFYMHRSFAFYKGAVRKIMHKYKYRKMYDLSKLLVGFLRQAYDKYYRKAEIDYVETVPGEHMQILCSEFSRVIKIPFAGNILKEAFKVRNSLLVSGKNVLLIDDIWTTGSTLNEISKVLKNSNADKIYLLTIAGGT